MMRRRLLMSLIRGDNVLIKKGSFKLNTATRADQILIQHNLGVIPQIFIIDSPNFDNEIVTRSSDVLYGSYNSIYASHLPNTADMDTSYYASASATTPTYTSMNANNPGRNNFINSLTANSCCAIAYNNNYLYAPDVTYEWIAIAGIE